MKSCLQGTVFRPSVEYLKIMRLYGLLENSARDDFEGRSFSYAVISPYFCHPESGEPGPPTSAAFALVGVKFSR